MAVNIVMGAGPPAKSSRARTKPRKLFRGVTRTLMRKTLAKLQSILNRDFRENTRAAILGYEPALVADVARSATRNAFDKVVDRLTEALAAKEGDE